jgi:hypothetical protein
LVASFDEKKIISERCASGKKPQDDKQRQDVKKKPCDCNTARQFKKPG